MVDQLQELIELVELLKLEKLEDFTQFKDLIQKLPLNERKEKGYTWYPVQVLKSGYTFGERAFVIIENTAENPPQHQFRAGKIVNLFTSSPDVKRPERSGVIHYVKDKKMKIILNVTDLPDWIGGGSIGVDLMFDERTYLEMEKALNLVMKAKQNRLAELRAIFLGQQQARFRVMKEPIQIPTLNESQNKAINQVIAAQDVAIIHGPPGTGKTTTLVQAVKILCQTEKTVLVTAPSNTAVDLLSERLSEQGLNVVRVGNISRVDDQIISLSLDMQLANHPESKNIKKLKIQAAENRRKAQRFKRKYGRKEQLERRALYQEAGELMAWANQLEERLIDQILESAQVISCTLVGANSKVLEKRKFRTVVVDEAAQALEPATWIPIIKASKVVLTGDPFQLPPTVKSNEAQKKGFSITMIEKSLERLDKVSLLNVQYRMHEMIMNFSNAQFYQNELKAAETVKDHKLSIPDNHPLLFIDTAGCGFNEEVNPKYKSRFNPGEFQILCEHLYQLVDAYEVEDLPSIAIISPYREQVVHMNKMMEEDPKLAGLPISINTIDAFQGQERDVIYISLVRSNEKGQIGFLGDTRRMNVAMTRAKKKLIVIGDSATIGSDRFYQEFLEYCDAQQAYQTAWEYMA